jgi:polysaccharide pyruvyl transferase WcaK-like protein
MHTKSSKNIVLWGGYGWGNVGDELTLAVAIAKLKEQSWGKISIITPNPGYTRALFPDLEIIPFQPAHRISLSRRITGKFVGKLFGLSLPVQGLRSEWQTAIEGNWVSAIRQADCLYLVGGGYFSSLFTLYDRFLLPVEVAKSCGTPVVTAPLGIGPIDNPKLADRFARAFQGASICVRDETSADFCRKHGLKVSIKPDDGFRVGKIIDIKSSSIVRDSNEIVLGVNYFPQHGARDKSAFQEWWRELLHISAGKNITIEGFCFHNNIFDDFEAMVELFASVGLPSSAVKPPSLDFRDACRDLSRYSMIASSRFHAVVVANAIGIPCLGVSGGDYYHAKMNAACEGSDKAHHIRLLDTDPSVAFELLMTKHHAPKS